MFVQAKLPDINSAIVRHRTGALTAMAQLNYALASTELSAINALMPVQYKIKIDSELYKKIMKGQDVMICTECKTQTEYNTITFFKKQIDIQLQLLFSVEKIDFWQCPKCLKDIPKEGADRLIKAKANPFYAECIPQPPKKDNFGNTMNYQHEFEKWFDIALSEIENKIGIYRTDYARQENSDDIPDDEDDNADN